MKEFDEIISSTKESPEKVITAFDEFINAQYRMVPTAYKRMTIDDYHSGRVRLTRLFPKISEIEAWNGLYGYDEEKWCNGCDYNCGRRWNTLEFGIFQKDRAESISKDILKMGIYMSPIPRNLMFCGTFKVNLQAYTGKDIINGKEETGQISAVDGNQIHIQKIPYSEARRLMGRFRELCPFL